MALMVMVIFKFDMTMIVFPLKSVNKLVQCRDHAKGTIPSEVMSDFVNWFEKELILK